MDIKVFSLSKSFGQNRVLDNLNLTFSKHEITCIMGPSGCGKTTLLNILMGLVSPDSGSVAGVPERKSAVFQEDRLCESFSAVSNVRLVCDKKVDDRTIIAHLERVGLKDRDSYRQPVSKLSGGMKRRVAIVRAVLAPSDILFLDEPFKGLDENTKELTIEYIKKNTKGQTVIMVTHNFSEVKAFNAKLLQLNR